MSKFTFTSTAQCEKCGKHHSSSDADCDHNGRSVDMHVFRELTGGRDTMVGVEATMLYKWNALEEKVGDDWKQYVYIGTQERINMELRNEYRMRVIDFPIMEMPHVRG